MESTLSPLIVQSIVTFSIKNVYQICHLHVSDSIFWQLVFATFL